MICNTRGILLKDFFSLSVVMLIVLYFDCTNGRYFGSRRHLKCDEKPLEEREEQASVVLTGTVRDLVVDPLHSSTYKGQVEVKSIYKGTDEVRHASFRSSHYSNREMIMVEGFGDPNICVSSVGKHDTRIFLMKKGKNGSLRLQSSVLRVTLNNLNHAYAAVKDIPYVPPPKPPETLCRPFCSFHATCRVHARNSTPYCACIESCPDVDTRKHVCGTDGQLYSSECSLKKYSCQNKHRVNVANISNCLNRPLGQVIKGLCHSCYVFPEGKQNPCKDAKCDFGALCVPSLDGLQKHCRCPVRCDSYGDSVGSTPVCGDNGKDYNNTCELRRDSCNSMKEIKIKYYGKCEPCLGHECTPPMVCQLGKNRKPECRCAKECKDVLSPVCGTDGRTYGNECTLHMEACRQMRNITVLFQESCKKGNPCDTLKCHHGQYCTIDRKGIARCICHPKCEKALKQVCGTDGKTYDNECELNRQSCQQRTDVQKKHVGPCGPHDPCRHIHCEYGARCVLIGRQPTCECPQCSSELAPVCGSDGLTYNNECILRVTGCKEKTNVTKIKDGECSDCDHGQKKCNYYAECVKEHGTSSCKCPTKCESRKAEVCGTNGQTYENECMLRIDSCKRQTQILIASIGACKQCKNIICKNGEWCDKGECVCPALCPDTYDPVCASDQQTYQNECKMKKESCLHNKGLLMVSRGLCETDDTSESGSGALCDENCIRFGGECLDLDEDLSTCNCNFNCPAIRSRVCGSDGNSYGSECLLREEACRLQREITLAPLENCDDDFSDSCDGSMPLRNPRTNLEYSCSEKSNLNCPENSYCHILEGDTYGKCCEQEMNAGNCQHSDYGCCPDNETFAQGPDGIGCPGKCQCNPRGSKSTMCDKLTNKCLCKKWVGGPRCDHCLAGYWGLALRQYTQGCKPCNCNVMGRLRSDCDQTNGQCTCKPGISGLKCDRCPNGYRHVDVNYGCDGRVLPPPTSCEERPRCEYGAVCRVRNHVALCLCDRFNCNDRSWKQSVTVCGSDGITYDSECHLNLESCLRQIQIDIDYEDPCDTGRTTNNTRRMPTYWTTTPPNNSRSPRTTFTDKWTSLPKTTKIPPPPPTNIAGGKITDLCMDNSYCYVPNSLCRLGVCFCKKGYIATLDNTHCSEVLEGESTKSQSETACSLNPCRNGGKCIVDPELGYRCLCPFGKTGPNCRKEVDEISTPSFSGKSYMAVTNMSKTNDLTIEFLFKSFNMDGLLMFSSQYSNGTGDFISLALVNGFVEFSYDLGSGSAVIRSSQPFQLNREVKMVANLHERDGVLLINDKFRATGMSPPSLTDLDLNGPVYLGYVEDEEVRDVLRQKAGVNLGFAGCLLTVKIGHKTYDITYQSDLPRNVDVLFARDIRQCEKNPCQSMPCSNGGTCLMADLESYTCHCDPDYTGEHCETILNSCVRANCQFGATCRQIGTESFECVCPENREGDNCEYEKLQKIYVPEFNGSSYIQLPLGEVGTNTLSFKIWFLTRRPNGVLMYASQYKDGHGDFISVNLISRHVEFRFNMGSGTVIIRSDRKIQLNKWHEVYIEKVNRTGKLKIDNNNYMIYTGEIGGNLDELNLQNQRTLYLGGFRSRNNVPLESNITTNFTGVIQRIYINGRSVEEIMEVKREAVNINEYIGPPCNVNPCLNGGVCVPKLTGADCNCPIKYIGQRCEKRADAINKDLPVKFDGTTHLQYMNQIRHKVKSQRTNKYMMKFRMMSRNSGLILFQQGKTNNFGDYFAIAVNNGFVELSYNLGEEDKRHPHIIRSTVEVNDGNWHTLVAQRDERRGSLQVDEERMVEGFSREGSTQLDTDGVIWIGGKHNLPDGLPKGYYNGFMGCVDKIDIDNQKLHMVDHKVGHRSTSIKFCK